jgi:hypothetical protein
MSMALGNNSRLTSLTNEGLFAPHALSGSHAKHEDGAVIY